MTVFTYVAVSYVLLISLFCVNLPLHAHKSLEISDEELQEFKLEFDSAYILGHLVIGWLVDAFDGSRIAFLVNILTPIILWYLADAKEFDGFYLWSMLLVFCNVATIPCLLCIFKRTKITEKLCVVLGCFVATRRFLLRSFFDFMLGKVGFSVLCYGLMAFSALSLPVLYKLFSNHWDHHFHPIGEITFPHFILDTRLTIFSTPFWLVLFFCISTASFDNSHEFLNRLEPNLDNFGDYFGVGSVFGLSTIGFLYVHYKSDKIRCQILYASLALVLAVCASNYFFKNFLPSILTVFLLGFGSSVPTYLVAILFILRHGKRRAAHFYCVSHALTKAVSMYCLHYVLVTSSIKSMEDGWLLWLLVGTNFLPWSYLGLDGYSQLKDEEILSTSKKVKRG